MLYKEDRTALLKSAASIAMHTPDETQLGCEAQPMLLL
jgi:hypothetical protein